MDELMNGLENDIVKEMPDINEMGELRQDVETLHVELLKNHRIDPDLYEKYLKENLQKKRAAFAVRCRNGSVERCC